jgi:uncharacterized protein
MKRKDATSGGDIYLLDVNVLVALLWPNHMHHGAVIRWFGSNGDRKFATCPLTELGFTRLSCNPSAVGKAITLSAALETLSGLSRMPNHRFLGETAALPALLAPIAAHVVGHRQVSDAYLIALARFHSAKLGTLDARIRRAFAGSEWVALVEDVLT